MKLRRPNLTCRVARGLELLLSPHEMPQTQLVAFAAPGEKRRRVKGISAQDVRDVRTARRFLARLIVWHREHTSKRQRPPAAS